MALAHQRIGAVQFASLLGRLAHRVGAGAGAGQLVRVVLTEQTTIGALDLPRLGGFPHAEQLQGFLVRIARARRHRRFTCLARVVLAGGRLQIQHLARRAAGPAAPEQDQVALALADLRLGGGQPPAAGEHTADLLGPLAQPTQRQQQAIVARLAPIERLDGAALLLGVQAKAAHFRAGLGDVRLPHAPVALGQTPEQDEQQVVVVQLAAAPAQALDQSLPGTDLQTPVQAVAEHATQERAGNARNRQAGGCAQQGDRPTHVQDSPIRRRSACSSRSWVPTSIQRPVKCSALADPSACARRSSGASLKAPSGLSANSRGCSTAIPL